jgi:arginyl-tRNA synthetase
MFTKELAEAEKIIRTSLDQEGLPQPDTIPWSPTPFSGRWGYGTPVCFQIAAAEAKSGKKTKVAGRAQEIATSILPNIDQLNLFAEVEAVNGYLNLYINAADYAKRVIEQVITLGQAYGCHPARDEIVMVEFAQPNTHHSFHIGHTRNAILGESVARLSECAGYNTLRASYPGDIGLGVITCMWGYQRAYRGQEPEGIHERGQWLAQIYTEANSLVTPKDGETEAERSRREAYDAERRDMYKRWDNGDPEIRELWKTTRQWSLDELEDILHLLDIDIDVYFFESEVDAPSKEIVEELIHRGIAQDERPDGPVIVKIDELLGLDHEKYRTAVILRSDGTTLYSTKDLALAKEKFEKYHVDRSLYIVDVRQSLHFQQVFKILELWGFPQAKNCHHLSYGFVTLPEGAMSARKGNVILFTDVYEDAIRRVESIIDEKNPDLPQEIRTEVVKQIGLGALKYSMLSVDNIKDIVFDWDAALSFEGQSAPYIQNAAVRASSILRNAGDLPEAMDFDYDLDPAEIELISVISKFPAIVEKAAMEIKPLMIATYAYDLAKAFHLFYHAVRVLQAETAQMQAARLGLCAAARQTISNALHLLGIDTPDQM